MTDSVSIVIPCLEEEKFIGLCLDSILDNDFPKAKLEVLVIDGMSNDNTRSIITKYSQKYPFIKMLDNPKKKTPSALNIGIKNAKYDIIMRIDAHSIYEKEYISKCVKYLNEYKADNVGGVRETLARDDNFISQAIAVSMSHSFAAGNATYRTGTKSPKWVDTVFGGCYRKEVLEKIGLFNEVLTNCQDKDLNIRLREAGGKILLVPDIRCYYYTRSDVKNFCKYSFKMGFMPFYFARVSRKLLSSRNYIPPAFVITLMVTGSIPLLHPVFFAVVFAYLALDVFFSAGVAFDKRDIRYLPAMFIIFPTVHILYGLGAIRGCLKRS